MAERSAERVFESQAHEAALLVERLRTAQQSYVAAGQGADYWMGKLRRHARNTRAHPRRPGRGGHRATGARTAAARAAELVGQHARLDARARTYIRSGAAPDGVRPDLHRDERHDRGDRAVTRTRRRTEQRALADCARRGVAAAAGLRARRRRARSACCAPCCSSRAAGRRLPEDTREALRALMNDGVTRRQRTPCVQSRARHPAPTGQPGRTASVIRLEQTAEVPALACRSLRSIDAGRRLCADLARGATLRSSAGCWDAAAGVVDASRPDGLGGQSRRYCAVSHPRRGRAAARARPDGRRRPAMPTTPPRRRIDGARSGRPLPTTALPAPSWPRIASRRRRLRRRAAPPRCATHRTQPRRPRPSHDPSRTTRHVRHGSYQRLTTPSRTHESL